MSPAAEDQGAIQLWRDEIEVRAAGGKHAVARGRRKARPAASGSWFCEGRWQHDDQMDIWACLDEAELDRRRAAGLDEEPDDETETDEQD